MTEDRVISIGGIVFALATFSGLMLVLHGAAVGDTTNVETAAWLSDGGHRARTIAGTYVICGGTLAFMVFAAGVLHRLRRAGAPALALQIAQFGAIAFSMLALAAAAGLGSAAYSASANLEPKPLDPGAVRVSTFGFMLWAIPAALTGAMFMASASAAALASGALPKWLALLGFLLAAIALYGIAFLPTLGLLAWALLVAVVVLVREAPNRLAETRPSPA